MVDDSSLDPVISRRHPHRSIDWQRIQKVLGADTIASHTLLDGGASNTNYHLKMSSGKEYVCRQYTRGLPQKDYQAMKLIEDELPVPTIFEAGDDWALMRFLHGKPITADS